MRKATTAKISSHVCSARNPMACPAVLKRKETIEPSSPGRIEAIFPHFFPKSLPVFSSLSCVVVFSLSCFVLFSPSSRSFLFLSFSALSFLSFLTVSRSLTVFFLLAFQELPLLFLHCQDRLEDFFQLLSLRSSASFSSDDPILSIFACIWSSLVLRFCTS